MFMKIRITLILSVIIYHSINAQSTQDLDRIFGFKNIKFMSNVSEYENIINLKEGDRLEFFPVIKWDSKFKEFDARYDVLDDVELKNEKVRVSFNTINGNIYRIDVSTKLSRFEALEFLNRAFGKPTISIDKEDWLNPVIMDSIRGKVKNNLVDRLLKTSIGGNYIYIWSGEKASLRYTFSQNNTVNDAYLGLTPSQYERSKRMGMISEPDMSDHSVMEFYLNEIYLDKLIKEISIPKFENALDEFSSDIISSKETENNYPIRYEDIEQLFVLDKKWFSSGYLNVYTISDNNRNDIFKPQTSGFDKFVLQIAKNSTQSIALLCRQSQSKFISVPNVNFIGNLEMILENGNKITCIDRKYYGNQKTNNDIDEVFNVYYLTDVEYEMLKTNKIIGVSFKYGPINAYSPGTVNQTYQTKLDFKDLLEAIDAHIKEQ